LTHAPIRNGFITANKEAGEHSIAIRGGCDWRRYAILVKQTAMDEGDSRLQALPPYPGACVDAAFADALYQHNSVVLRATLSGDFSQVEVSFCFCFGLVDYDSMGL
jgi:hypothetical protein